jgi:tetratricopeptide (TPR) repeat protein
VAESSRLEVLRRRVQDDPSSIAFAQLAEEYRRAAMFQEAVDVCRAGLSVHPAYLSARVTLGRALIELQQFDDARHELQQVLQSAPENLAAIRGLADVYHRTGALADALTQYRSALAIAKHDPDLEQTIAELERQVQPQDASNDDDGLSFEQAAQELLAHAPAPSPVSEPEIRAQDPAILALQQFLDAVHVARAERHA